HTSFSRDWSSDVCSSDLRLILRVLAKISIFLRVDFVPHLVKSRTALFYGTNLLKKIAQIVSKSSQIRLGANFEMAGHNMVHGKLQNLIQGLDPVFDAAVVHGGARPV